MTDSNWKPFWWESNMTWGRIESPEDWSNLVSRLSANGTTAVDIGKARECPFGHGKNDSKIPKFGFRIECDGDLVLKEWANQNEMILDGVND